MEDLGYGMIGCGRIAGRHMAAAETIEGARLVAVADSNYDKAKHVAEGRASKPTAYGDYRELLADDAVDMVVIGVPTQLHREVTVAAAEAGKHIYCEKAMAATPRQCREMIAAAREHGVKLTIGQSTRFQPPFALARRVISSGAIGEVFAINGRFTAVAEPPSRGATDSWRYRAGSAGNGHVINFGCHYIDTARFLMGQDPASVSACIANLFSEGMIYEDQFVVTCRCDRGGIISIALHSPIQQVSTHNEGFTIYGTEGVLEACRRPDGITLVRGGGEPQPVEMDDDLTREDAFLRLHRQFREAIENDGEVPVTGEDAMKNVEWGLAAYLSAEGRCWVDLPLGPEHDDFAGPVLASTIPATRE